MIKSRPWRPWIQQVLGLKSQVEASNVELETAKLDSYRARVNH